MRRRIEAYAIHSAYYLDGFNSGREKVLLADMAHEIIIRPLKKGNNYTTIKEGK
jgi:hypothetical protein